MLPQQNMPEIITIIDQPTSTEVSRTYANMGPNILLTAMRRGTQGMLCMVRFIKNKRKLE